MTRLPAIAFIHIRPLYLCVLLALSLLVSMAGVAPAVEIDVWIDPGHGGTDIGAKGINGVDFPNEDDLNLAIAEDLEPELFSRGYFCVHKTRNTDQFMLRPTRAKIANGELANDEPFMGTCRLFLSIHMNSSGNASAHGTETWHARTKYFAKNAKVSQTDINAANHIQQDLITYADVAFGGPCSDNRGIKEANFTVLTRSMSPAVLVEVCFISRQCQWDKIIQAQWQAYLAEGIASGVSGFLGLSTCQFAETPQADIVSSVNVPLVVTSTASPGLHVETPAISAARSVLTTLVEDFESVTFPPAGWTKQTTGLPAPHTWHRTTDPDFVGQGTASAFVGSGSASAIDEWLISPAVAIAAPDDVIKFSWSGSKYWTSALNASLSVRQTGTITWTQLWSLSANEPDADPFIYRERIIDVSGWTGINVEFGFRVVGTNGASVGLDGIAVGDFVPTGTAPNDVCASASTLPSVFSVQGLTCYAADDLDPYAVQASCVSDPLDGPDVFFQITAAWGDTLHASVTADWNAGLYLVDDCLTPVCVAAAFPEDGSAVTEITHRFAPGGTYYLVVDGMDGSCGPFELSGEVVDSPTGVRPGGVPPLKLVARPNPAAGPVRLFGSFPSSPGTQSTLEIFDVAGRRLQRFESRADSGELSFVWDHRDDRGQRVASGLYFARLRVGSESVVEKFVILR